METPDYLNFSRVGGKDKLNDLLERARVMYIKCAEAPEAAKKNLMETDFKIAGGMHNLVKTVAQAEGANALAMTTADSRTNAKGELIRANIPGLKEPKKLKA